MMINRILAFLLILPIGFSANAQKVLKLGIIVPIVDGVSIKDSTNVQISYNNNVIYKGRIGNNGISRYGEVVDVYYKKDEVEKGGFIEIIVNSKDALSVRLDGLNLKSNFIGVSYHERQFYIYAEKKKH